MPGADSFAPCLGGGGAGDDSPRRWLDAAAGAPPRGFAPFIDSFDGRPFGGDVSLPFSASLGAAAAADAGLFSLPPAAFPSGDAGFSCGSVGGGLSSSLLFPRLEFIAAFRLSRAAASSFAFCSSSFLCARSSAFAFAFASFSASAFAFASSALRFSSTIAFFFSSSAFASCIFVVSRVAWRMRYDVSRGLRRPSEPGGSERAERAAGRPACPCAARRRPVAARWSLCVARSRPDAASAG